ncbi:group II intron reverse transcriptase/maturase [Arthrobacter sp.]|uniref:group II intron reverse transcriptase/maturase n=1 Tax=Arthrobacter sp. TaxID=1667 RepID=UPI0025865D46|nr:group II intron reverse transcriptase/maturase [Arthrobacter sp.]
MKPEDVRSERSGGPAPDDTDAHPAKTLGLWEQVMSRENLALALRRVERNAGAAGIDAMTAAQLRPWLKEHWPGVRAALDAGTYRPRPVRRVMIPKPAGGQRPLGVPTVLDRLIQQAVLGVLEPLFEPHFSDHSYGFRPGRSAHQAVERARQFMQDDAAWVVDVDLDAFFDRVGHDVLMARIARRVDDPRLLRLLRRYLQAGVMSAAGWQPSEQGTPQGSPLSPLLANIMLSDLDAELERRGHRFVRYADDLRVYVASERAGQRVMASITQFIEQRLKLRVNRRKSAVAPAGTRPFLGFGFYRRGGQVRIGVSPKSRQRAKDRLRELTARRWGVAMERRIDAINRFTVGWTAYFRLAEGERPFSDLDAWLRRRLRQVRWKEWKRPKTRVRNLRALGAERHRAHEWAFSGKGPWRVAGSWILSTTLTNAYWTSHGLHGFLDPYRRFRDATRTAGCGPACPVVWEAPG